MNRPLSLALAAALALTTFASEQKKPNARKAVEKSSAPTKEITSPRDPATGQATGRTKARPRNKQ